MQRKSLGLSEICRHLSLRHGRVAWRATSLFLALFFSIPLAAQAQQTSSAPRAKAASRPKLVVVLVVDQFRADYVEKFRHQWSAGLKRLIEQGAWFREAAYPYAATETCVGHATISTGAFPATHGIVANAWWDRDQDDGKGKLLTCTADPSGKVQNYAYGGLTTRGADSPWRLAIPTLADELRFQTGGATRVVTLSLKARAAIMLAGHKAEEVTWFDAATGAWATSNHYVALPFVYDFALNHPVKEDLGKTWEPALAPSEYLYADAAFGAVPPEGWGPALPHALRAKDNGTNPDRTFYQQWQASPFSDAYLERLAEASVEALELGQRDATDFLGIGFSALDYAGHAFGPRSHEVQDVLVRLDRTLGALFRHLDDKVGRENYVVALSGDHGVVPIPEDMRTTGVDAGWLFTSEVQTRIEKALASFQYAKPAVANIGGSDIYFAPGVYDKLKQEPAVMRAVLKAIESVPGVARVYRADEVAARDATASPLRKAISSGYFPGRGADMFIVQKAYWGFASWPANEQRPIGTVHGSPYLYDQRVPILFMGTGIQAGEYWAAATPADIAPTLAALCGITLAPRDGRVLSEALAAKPASAASSPQAPQKPH